MKSDNCGNGEAVRMSFRKDACVCDKCGVNSAFKFSDVYFNQAKGEYFDPHIAHPDKYPHGAMIKSREHKALLMKELGIRESGDKFHGSR